MGSADTPAPTLFSKPVILFFFGTKPGWSKCHCGPCNLSQTSNVRLWDRVDLPEVQGHHPGGSRLEVRTRPAPTVFSQPVIFFFFRTKPGWSKCHCWPCILSQTSNGSLWDRVHLTEVQGCPPGGSLLEVPTRRLPPCFRNRSFSSSLGQSQEGPNATVGHAFFLKHLMEDFGTGWTSQKFRVAPQVDPDWKCGHAGSHRVFTKGHFLLL